MPSLPISTVRQNLFGLVQQVNDDHEPLTVVTKSGENAVLVAESDWNELMETNYVLRTHGGAQLLKSAQDARDGNTEAHGLIDPDEPTSEEVPAFSEGPREDHLIPAAVPDLLYMVVRRVMQETDADITMEAKRKVLDQVRWKLFHSVPSDLAINFPGGQIYVDPEHIIGGGTPAAVAFARTMELLKRNRPARDEAAKAEEEDASESGRKEGARRA